MASNRVPTPPPLHDLPTAKEKKYDRQLRLWGASGQAALEETHILLVNNGSGVTGIEALKNLVLPGIGQFSILDPAIVTEADLGVNFFLEDESLGKFRAEETVRLLEELNPDAKGTAVKEVRKRCMCASVHLKTMLTNTCVRSQHPPLLLSLGRILRPLLRPASQSLPDRRHTS
jgi:tRNA A37 threonylcarbamoyladenosine dehydratase